MCIFKHTERANRVRRIEPELCTLCLIKQCERVKRVRRIQLAFRRNLRLRLPAASNSDRGFLPRVKLSSAEYLKIAALTASEIGLNNKVIYILYIQRKEPYLSALQISESSSSGTRRNFIVRKEKKDLVKIRNSRERKTLSEN
ncbi:hypothetical protein NDU88_000816 [Pleurodeles waltl]|uniref:Uncharacterized protein n=1 Tax=Pleurodeles waltl TaxID=8319 RepID=A0AAV7SXH5_PLEWA|nr:hypothetical protein NDU88_000816 [Pleurodeles waltl]